MMTDTVLQTFDSTQTLAIIPLAKLHDHPQNPRLVMRDDVINAITAGLADGFHPSHALIVRPVDDVYQILSGHHRKAAALKAGLEAVPCWVRPMSDEDAYMALVTSNSQGELSPLEIGMHALHCVGLSKGGRGQKGGLSGYAESIGRKHNTVSQLVSAARVCEKVSVDRQVLQDKTQHLAAIHALPETCWQVAVETILAGGWSAKETAERVKNAKATGNTPKRVAALFLSKTTEKEIARIDALKERLALSLDYDDLKTQWLDWFSAEQPIDIKDAQNKRLELEQINDERKAEERKAEAEKQAEDLSPPLPQLVLADPPWSYDFAQSDSRQIENQYPTGSVADIIDHKPETEKDCVLFLWATVAKLQEAMEVMDGWGFQYKTHAVWDKEKIGMGYWFRGQHELLLVGTKGTMSPPQPEQRRSSVFREPRDTKHSAKPISVYEWIESAFPDLVKLEMYCRNPRQGWQVFGNESREAA